MGVPVLEQIAPKDRRTLFLGTGACLLLFVFAAVTVFMEKGVATGLINLGCMFALTALVIGMCYLGSRRQQDKSLFLFGIVVSPIIGGSFGSITLSGGLGQALASFAAIGVFMSVLSVIIWRISRKEEAQRTLNQNQFNRFVELLTANDRITQVATTTGDPLVFLVDGDTHQSIMTHLNQGAVVHNWYGNHATTIGLTAWNQAQSETKEKANG
jgi:hypothetical protein